MHKNTLQLTVKRTLKLTLAATKNTSPGNDDTTDVCTSLLNRTVCSNEGLNLGKEDGCFATRPLVCLSSKAKANGLRQSIKFALAEGKLCPSFTEQNNLPSPHGSLRAPVRGAQVSTIYSNLNYNQNINKRLNYFLKTYKFEKLANNYKEFNFVCPLGINKKQTLRTLSALPLAGSADGKGGQTTTANSMRVLANLGAISNPAPHGSLRDAPAPMRGTNMTYNNLKQLMKLATKNKFTNANFFTKNDSRAANPRVGESNLFPPRESAQSTAERRFTRNLRMHEVQAQDPMRGPRDLLLPTKLQVNSLFRPVAHNLDKTITHRTYRFLQTILAKYLETTPNLRSPNGGAQAPIRGQIPSYLAEGTSRRLSALQMLSILPALPSSSLTGKDGIGGFATRNLGRRNPRDVFANSSLLRKKVKTKVYETSTSNFLLNKINNKSFLAYWLIPVAGLTLITPSFYNSFSGNYYSSQMHLNNLRYAQAPMRGTNTNTFLSFLSDGQHIAMAEPYDGRQQSGFATMPQADVQAGGRQGEKVGIIVNSPNINQLRYWQGQSSLLENTQCVSNSVNNLYAFISAKTYYAKHQIKRAKMAGAIAVFPPGKQLLLHPPLLHTMENFLRLWQSNIVAKQPLFNTNSKINFSHSVGSSHKSLVLRTNGQAIYQRGINMNNQTLLSYVRIDKLFSSNSNSMLYLKNMHPTPQVDGGCSSSPALRAGSHAVADPFYSKTLLNNNINFITTHNTLKLLQCKMTRTVGDKYINMQLNKDRSLAALFTERWPGHGCEAPKQNSSLPFHQGSKAPLRTLRKKSVQERTIVTRSLDAFHLINLNIKKNLFFGKNIFDPLSTRYSLRPDKTKMPLSEVQNNHLIFYNKLSKAISYKILFKGSARPWLCNIAIKPSDPAWEPARRAGDVTKKNIEYSIDGFAIAPLGADNKNHLLLNYFLFNEPEVTGANAMAVKQIQLVLQPSMREKPTKEKSILKLKLNLIKTSISRPWLCNSAINPSDLLPKSQSNAMLIQKLTGNLVTLSAPFGVVHMDPPPAWEPAPALRAGAGIDDKKTQVTQPLKLNAPNYQKLVSLGQKTTLNTVNLYFNYINQKIKKYVVLNNIHPFPARESAVPASGSTYFSGEDNLVGRLKRRDRSNVVQTKFVLKSGSSDGKHSQCAASASSKQFLNSISIVFKHKKMFKNPTEAVTSRLHLQKKRKAKKQRLETRRQKKRTRFFPRPMWLRYRMFLNFVNPRLTSRGHFTNVTSNLRHVSGNITDPISSFSALVLRTHGQAIKEDMALTTKAKASAKQSDNLLPARSAGSHTGEEKYASNKIVKNLKSHPKTKWQKALAPHGSQRAPVRGAQVDASHQLVSSSLSLFPPRLTARLQSNQKKELKLVGIFPRQGRDSNGSSLRRAFPMGKVTKAVLRACSKLSTQRSDKTNYLRRQIAKKNNLRDIKIKANYVNFKNQKTNNPPLPTDKDKDKDKDTMFRDFWIWAYNNSNYTLGSSTNNYHANLWWLLPNNTSSVYKKSPNNTSSVYKKSPKNSSVSMAKTVLFRTKSADEICATRRLPYGATLSSKQIKNAFAITRIHWALNKTNAGSFTDYNKRYNLWGTQKLRNQSKNNKTKYLEKQFITNWEKFFLNKKLNVFYKKISSKLYQKTQKLNYLTSTPCRLPQKAQIGFAINPAGYKRPKSTFKTQNISIFNTAWWSNLNLKPLLVSASESDTYLSLFSFPQTVNKSIFMDFRSSSLKEGTDKGSQNTSTLLIISSVLLHFCALISLVSISQVRCFVKFHLILLYKLSNIYNALIGKISGYIVSSSVGENKTKPALSQRRLQSSLMSLKIKSGSTRPMNLRPARHAGSQTGGEELLGQLQNINKLLTYFSINLLKKEFSASLKGEDKGLLCNLPLSESLQRTRPTPYGSLRAPVRGAQVGLRRTTISPSAPDGAIAKQSLFLKFNRSPHGSQRVAQVIYSKLNIISGVFSFLKRRAFPVSGGASPLTGLVSLEYSYKINRTKLSLKKAAHLLMTSSKNTVFKLVFNIIDVFQSSVRTISSFFEKPAEFTTTWIAYGFLVEWSSDLITIIPENVDIYIWNAFSKVSRIVPISLVLNYLPGSLLASPPLGSLNVVQHNYMNSASFVTTSSHWQTTNYVPVLLTISHLLHRRILYLFDTFIETISQPDADLIRRQQKGTLFWDMWADFLVTAADYYNVNVAALSTIKAEQNTLIEKISNDFGLNGTPLGVTSQTFRSNNLKPNTIAINVAKHSSAVINTQKNTPTPNGSLRVAQDMHLIKNGEYVLRAGSLTGSEDAKFESLSFPAWEPASPRKGSAGFLRWSVNQYITYQSWHSHNGSNNSTGDLFIDYHPPKSFLHIPAIKYNSILQQPIGTLVCQIYAGIFNKQISKNILLVNTKTTAKQVSTDYNILLIQALAGETELKLITDNAQRYALVNRGFAIGIKLLRDVFDAIALNTPCIFLLEDIHAIGERRPMLISDYGGAMSDDNGSFKEDFFGSQRDEVHEKNQVVYQLTRHALTHYKKPFKGDYSLAIPTNLFVTDLFLKVPTQSTSNLSLIENHNLTIKNKIKQKSTQEQGSAPSGALSKNADNKPFINTHQRIKQTNTHFAPPSTSPFTVLLSSGEKKLKQNKIVEEFPWTGLPGEQLSIKPRASYSVRAKVAMLAELSLSNLSAKLDMITDLLVIIDSVRSNKGFVVFATTDVPNVLDPALRRPGRLDETICMPNVMNSDITLRSNYEIIKSVKPSEERCFRGAQMLGTQNVLTVNLRDYNTVLNIAKHSLPFGWPGHGCGAPKKENLSLNYASISHSNNLKIKKASYAVRELHQSLSIFKTIKPIDLSPALRAGSHGGPTDNWSSAPDGATAKQSKTNSYMLMPLNVVHQKGKTRVGHNHQLTKEFYKQNKFKALAYYEVGKVLLSYYSLNSNKPPKKQAINFNPSKMSIEDVSDLGSKGMVQLQNNQRGAQRANESLNLKSINYLSLYASKNKLLLQLMLLFGGKISQLLSSKKNKLNLHMKLDNLTATPGSHAGSVLSSKTIGFIAAPLGAEGLEFDDFDVRSSNFSVATSLMLAFIHKRYLYRKNLIVPKLLSFIDGNVLEEPPSPPFSSLLIPAKRFENYKRVFRDSIVGDKMGQRKAQVSLIEKLQYHMQLRSIKLLNNLRYAQAPIGGTNKGYSLSNDIGQGDNTINNSGTAAQLYKFSKSIKMKNNSQNYNLFTQNANGGGIPPLGADTFLKKLPADKLLQTTTNINWYYQNRILKRHGQYLINQWWNGQLSEHNAETVFLSDIDWRSSFIKNKQINVVKTKNLYTLSGQKNNSDGFDVLLDFPDADQYYNPRRRRWLLNKGYWSFWFNFDKVYSEEIISTWILESIIQTYTYLHNNTELLDFVTSKFITLGYSNCLRRDIDALGLKSSNSSPSRIHTETELSSIKEIILTNSFKRL